MPRTRATRRAERRRILVGEHDGVSRLAHRRRHTYASLLWTSKATLADGDIGTPRDPLQAGRLVEVRVSCKTAGTLIVTVDIKFDDASIYHTSTKPTIPATARVGWISHHQDRISFQVDTKIHIVLDDVGDVVGPIQVELLYEPEYR